MWSVEGGSRRDMIQTQLNKDQWAIIDKFLNHSCLVYVGCVRLARPQTRTRLSPAMSRSLNKHEALTCDTPTLLLAPGENASFFTFNLLFFHVGLEYFILLPLRLDNTLL